MEPNDVFFSRDCLEPQVFQVYQVPEVLMENQVVLDTLVLLEMVELIQLEGKVKEVPQVPLVFQVFLEILDTPD